MKYAFFQGCNIPIRIQQYATSTEAVLKQFGVQLVEMPEFNCCGYPVRNIDEKAYILPSVRNMAIAEQRNLNILVICNCCFASLQKAKHIMSRDATLKTEINTLLAKENLEYKGTVKIKHYLTVLHDEITTETIAKKLSNNFKNLNIAVIHGCHILRPREITGFDDSFVPVIAEELMKTTGATSLDWRGRLECCGAALAGINDDLSQKLLSEKIDGARRAGAEFITPICSYCHLQFDSAQKDIPQSSGNRPIPVLLYPQLLGLCLGIDEKLLGIHKNTTINPADIEQIKGLLSPPEKPKKKKRKKARATATA